MRIGFSQRLTNTKRSWPEDISAHNLRPARVCWKHTATYSFRASVREGRTIVVRGRQIAVFNLGDHFLAVDNRCPHQGGPLSEGIVSGTTVACPLHAWKIDLSGTVANAAASAACIATFRTRVSDGS
jgi:nitrite reductase (NADH) small subunit